MKSDDGYTREELYRLIDAVMDYPPCEGMLLYKIRGVYVSAAVIEQAILERLEGMAAERLGLP